MRALSKLYLFSILIYKITTVHAHDDGTAHEESDDNSSLIFLGIFVLAIALAFYISQLYGKKLRKSEIVE
ncbi:MAG: hypothetical protein GPJ54_17370 [Candidatus Heimdallarchaeota archaeon]|nr:hypothetical protein [Candidatus Heimdallarchaeota archaeon]